MRKPNFSFKKFLLEVVIVIIGISIAFWVNNLGERQKERNLEKEFLRSLKSDLRQDSTAYKYQIENNKVNLKYLDVLIDICRSQDYANDSTQWLVGRFLNRNNWILNTNTFDMLKSGGNLDIISDFELRNEISAFYHIRGFQSTGVLEIIQGFLDNQMYPYLAKNSDFYIKSTPSLGFVREREFQNLLVLWRDLTESKLDIYEGTIEGISQLLPKLN